MTAARKPHPAWRMMALCCLIQFGGMGVLANSIGVFFPAVCGELGFTVSQLSLHITVRGVATMLALPLASRLLAGRPSRLVVTPAAAALVLSIASMAFFHELWQWYAVSVIYGVAGAFLFLNLSPIILTNWFRDRTGFAVGTAMAFSGLGGMVMSPVGTWLIDAYGWRAAYLVFAAVGAVTMIPAALMLVRAPEDVGLEPYGAGTETAKAGAAEKSAPEASALPLGAPFWLFIAVALITSYETVYIYHFPQYTVSIGLTAMTGSMMSSASMAGNLAGKLGLGWVNDRMSAKSTYCLGSAVTAAGIAVMLLFPGGGWLPCAGAFLYGACMALTAVTVPLLALELFGRERYAKTLSAATMASSAIGGVGTVLVGAIYDGAGSYVPAFAAALVCCAAAPALLCAAYLLKTKKT